ncbi:hypothetical protein VSX64_23325 [Aurantimonas sp. C2-6-R+9]|uniref:hypothetical protein n=1 Tax=unclassified Aurantimonas TaxID=2638230 RepID=UPI002E19C5D5|nr:MULTISPECIES: hypothetical protein [unclassified Aurantimonas]MEC5293510.1 hypothetical protein [Aurantimonas sp. C2-3-R2]MEC5383686.1 hypothetical protein [Aurantimonas sp. C2-6-R+9]MEC5414587.1 hypothetical protein [Aurantimonas sp. C2-4-R8]
MCRQLKDHVDLLPETAFLAIPLWCPPGSPFFPYLMAGIGYPGLLLVTLLFIWRFLRSLAARNGGPLAVYTNATFSAEPAE